MTPQQTAALEYLKSFARWPEDWPRTGFLERRAEAMRRARMIGLTYTAIADAVRVTPSRVRTVVLKTVYQGQGVPREHWIRGNEKRAIKMHVAGQP